MNKSLIDALDEITNCSLEDARVLPEKAVIIPDTLCIDGEHFFDAVATVRKTDVGYVIGIRAFDRPFIVVLDHYDIAAIAELCDFPLLKEDAFDANSPH